MSNVTLSIGGREYKVACAAGEETHVTGLGRMIDSKLAAMSGISGQSEARTLLFAALLLADELHEAKTVPERSDSIDDEMAAWLDQFALRMEKLASHLESGQAIT